MARDRSGYIFRDKQGRWCARTTITDARGHRRNIKRLANNKREAKALLKNILRQLEAQGSNALDFSKLTFNDLADFYSTHYGQSAEYAEGKKITGLRDVKRAQGFLVRFREYFGKRRLQEITYSDIHSYRAMRLKSETHYKRPPTIATMNRELGVLRRIFNIAVREGWLSKNPFGAGEPLISPASERRRERLLTVDEERRLLAACRSKTLRAFLICLLDTGARKSELLKHLRWRSICFQTRTITIEGMTTKTLKGRQVAMTERVQQELSTLWGESRKTPDSRVFETMVNLRRAFASACESAGLVYGSPNGITLHSLRHTAATRLVQGGMSLQLAGRILGHSQASTTYRYVSANSETIAQAAAILERVQANASEPRPITASSLVN